MPLIDMLLPQFDRELETTRRLIEIVPGVELAWGPGGGARTFAELTGHLAEIPAWTCGIMNEEGCDLADVPVEGAVGSVAEAPPQLRAVVAVSPTMHLAMCVEALERPANRLYQWNFVRNLKRRMRRKARAWPGRFDLGRLGPVRTVREFDERFTAPHHGFRDAADYYHRASSLRVVDRVRVPTLVVSAADDPFIPPEQFHDPGIVENPHVNVQVTPHGGHCGFYAPAGIGFDGYWAERRAVDVVRERTIGQETAP